MYLYMNSVISREKRTRSRVSLKKKKKNFKEREGETRAEEGIMQ